MEKVLLMQDTLQACEFAMLQMQFTEEEKNALHHERFHNPHPRVQQRMEALLLKSHALPPAKIASTLKMDEGALRSYLQDYQQGGIEQLKIIKWHGSQSELSQHQGTVKDFFSKSASLDNARYQRCALVEAHARLLSIDLLFLPSYSPNLNLIERFWKYVKKDCLYSKYYPAFTEFKQAISTCIEQAPIQHKKELHSLLTLRFQTFDQSTVAAA